jgi:hypothetical protein
VVQALGGQGEDRRAETAGEEVAALGGQFADRQTVCVRWEALEAMVDALLGEPRERFGSGVQGHASLLK